MDISDNPVSGARIDVWQTAGDGFYDVQRTGSDELNRGVFTTGDDGRYWFKTVKPVSYEVPTDGPVGDMLRQMNRDAWRPAHIHFMLTAPGYRKLTTHIFVESDPYLEDDAVFAVRESLIRTFTQIEDPDEIQRRGFDGPFWKVDSDFVLQPEAPG
jgi:protocatechuate 3,4-dioxygenase beta subunit